MSLNGKHAFITGSSPGIGRGIALKLAEEGAKVAVHYYQNQAAANDTLAQVRERGSEGFVTQADVSQPDEISRLFKTVQSEFGTLDIFVNNARPEVAAFFYPPMDITLGRRAWRPAARELEAVGRTAHCSSFRRCKNEPTSCHCTSCSFDCDRGDHRSAAHQVRPLACPSARARQSRWPVAWRFSLCSYRLFIRLLRARKPS